MNLNETDFAWIVSYVDGTMDQEERGRLEQRAEADAEFAAALRSVRDSVRVLNADGKADRFLEFRSRMDEMVPETGDETTSPSSVKSSSRRRIWPWLAAASVILLLGIFFLLPDAKPKPEAVFAEYFEPLPPPPVPRSADAVSMPDGMEEYAAKDFAGAANLLENAWRKHPQDMSLLLRLANAEMATGKFKEAISHLKLMPDELEPGLQDHRDWYLALCYLRTGDLEQGRILLKALSTGEGFYQPRALEVLREIGK